MAPIKLGTSMSGSASMAATTIADLLIARGVRIEGDGLDLDRARGRAKLTRMIGEAYPAFEIARRMTNGHQPAGDPGPSVARVLAGLSAAGVAERVGTRWRFVDDGARYVSGGWLEEYGALAALAAGADEVRAGQVLRWVSGPFTGVNEVDVVARFGERLVFASCKALASRYQGGDAYLREKLTGALDAADNLVDHFGGEHDRAALIVSTDLVDERRDETRYDQLFGKAHALDVELVTLEDLAFPDLVARFRALAP